MASSKRSTKRACGACGEVLPGKEFANAEAEVCTFCASSGLKAKKPPQHTLPLEEENVFEAVELDPSNPTVRELAARIAAQNYLLPFIKRFRPKYDAGWVHKDICRRLERFMRQVEEKKSPRLLLMMPYRHGKSEISSRHFAPFVLGHHPDWEIIAASNAQSLATSFSRYIRDLMRSDSYTTLFDTRLDPSSQSVENWNTVGGGGYLAAGIGTAIIGRGAHVLLIDDPMRDAASADSQTIRDNTWEWYNSTAYSRLAPGGGVLGILTCWNDDDWAGRIEQTMVAGGDQFEIVRYPAINDMGDEYILLDDTIAQYPPGSTIPEGAVMTRPRNTALHEERYSLEALLKIKANYYASGQKRWWAAGYQQNPAPEDGQYFTKKMFRYYATPPMAHKCNIYQAWDFAITEGQQNDYTVCATIAQDEFDNIYVLDIDRFKSGDGEAIVERIIDNYVTHGAQMIGFEQTQIWQSLESTFIRRCQERRIYPAYENLKPFTDKFVRAQPLKGRMQMGRVWFCKDHHYYEELEKEMLRFGGGGKHDDQVDGLAWVIRLVLTKSAPKPLQEKPLKSWKDKLRMGTRKGSAMAA